MKIRAASRWGHVCGDPIANMDVLDINTG